MSSKPGKWANFISKNSEIVLCYKANTNALVWILTIHSPYPVESAMSSKRVLKCGNPWVFGTLKLKSGDYENSHL